MQGQQEYASVEGLIEGERGASVHLECGRATARRAVQAVCAAYPTQRRAFFLESDKGYDRETVRSYLRFFARLAGGGITAEEAMARFGLKPHAKTSVRKLKPEQRALLNFARMSLFEPEVCFCERPLMDLGPEARELVLSWMGTTSEAGCAFITAGQPLREAFLLPGTAWWEDEEGRLHRACTEEEDETQGETLAGDEVRVCKIAAKAGDATLLFNPREIDFIESANRVNYASVRGELYPTQLTLDELEAELERFGFFRCHRSYIVNVQKIAKVERYTRNSFNLTLSDAACSSIPLAKGRVEQMRTLYHWK